jgi:hypothetical protein
MHRQQETEKLGEDVVQFLDILRGKARVLSAMLRLAFKAGMRSANVKFNLCDDLIEQVGQLITSARVARAVYTEAELQRAKSCLHGALVQDVAIAADETQLPRKRQRVVGNKQ